MVAHFRSHQALLTEGSNKLNLAKSYMIRLRRELVGLRLSKKRNRLALAKAEKVVCIIHNLRAILKMENVDLNAKYVADLEAMLR